MEFTNYTAIEAEHRIIMLCIENPSDVDLVTAKDEDFFSLKWRSCFQVIKELRAEDSNMDALVVLDRMSARIANLNQADILNIDATPGMVPEYSRIVTEEASKRRLLLGLSGVINSLKTGLAASEALSRASQVISEATMGQPDSSNRISGIVTARYLELGQVAEDIKNGVPGATGIETGIDALDKHLGGIQTGIVTLLAGRPAMGKSSVALNFSEAASKAGVGVHIFSLEDTRDAYADRVISYHSGISASSIRSCEFSKSDLRIIGMAHEELRKRNHWLVDDRSGVTAEEIIRCVRRNRDANDTKMVIVDYIQLIRAEGREDARTKLSNAINAFGDAAKHDGMAYVILSQLNRGLEARPNKRPMLSDLKECGTLEERAKAVIMVYRDAVYNERSNATDMELLIRKNSNGKTGCVSVKWYAERMRIKSK